MVIVGGQEDRALKRKRGCLISALARARQLGDFDKLQGGRRPENAEERVLNGSSMRRFAYGRLTSHPATAQIGSCIAGRWHAAALPLVESWTMCWRLRRGDARKGEDGGTGGAWRMSRMVCPKGH